MVFLYTELVTCSRCIEDDDGFLSLPFQQKRKRGYISITEEEKRESKCVHYQLLIRSFLTDRSTICLYCTNVVLRGQKQLIHLAFYSGKKKKEK